MVVWWREKKKRRERRGRGRGRGRERERASEGSRRRRCGPSAHQLQCQARVIYRPRLWYRPLQSAMRPHVITRPAFPPRARNLVLMRMRMALLELALLEALLQLAPMELMQPTRCVWPGVAACCTRRPLMPRHWRANTTQCAPSAPADPLEMKTRCRPCCRCTQMEHCARCNYRASWHCHGDDHDDDINSCKR